MDAQRNTAGARAAEQYVDSEMGDEELRDEDDEGQDEQVGVAEQGRNDSDEENVDLDDDSIDEIGDADAPDRLEFPWLPSSIPRRPLEALSDRPAADDPANAPLPPYLKDISSLASWTVSTHKPGCGVAALRHPSPNYFWQSDGPQPHYLNIHFFKMVSIAHIRVYLDYEQDESYTPTKLHFVAGTGHHDLQDVCTMAFAQPKGWINVDLSNAGGPNALEDAELDDPALETQAKFKDAQGKPLPGLGPTLRCRIVQLRILENHQNGKDTHLRGLQLFAVDESAISIRRRKQISVKPSDKPESSSSKDEMPESSSDARSRATKKKKGFLGLREPDWMGEPTLR